MRRKMRFHRIKSFFVPDVLMPLVVMLVVIGFFIGLTCGVNQLINNRHLNKKATETFSYAKGFIGHVEYTRYKDISMEDIKVYPSILGHRYASSKLYQNLDGDDFIDIIRVNGPEWKMNRLEKILVRASNYEENQEAFEKADCLLKEMRQKTDLKEKKEENK